jgi:hypothetical protein
MEIGAQLGRPVDEDVEVWAFVRQEQLPVAEDPQLELPLSDLHDLATDVA